MPNLKFDVDVLVQESASDIEIIGATFRKIVEMGANESVQTVFLRYLAVTNRTVFEACNRFVNLVVI